MVYNEYSALVCLFDRFAKGNVMDTTKTLPVAKPGKSVTIKEEFDFSANLLFTDDRGTSPFGCLSPNEPIGKAILGKSADPDTWIEFDSGDGEVSRVKLLYVSE